MRIHSTVLANYLFTLIVLTDNRFMGNTFQIEWYTDLSKLFSFCLKNQIARRVEICNFQFQFLVEKSVHLQTFLLVAKAKTATATMVAVATKMQSVYELSRPHLNYQQYLCLFLPFVCCRRVLPPRLLLLLLWLFAQRQILWFIAGRAIKTVHIAHTHTRTHTFITLQKRHVFASWEYTQYTRTQILAY